ncbi:hypothetical protein Q0Z83_099780 [Actinoplanes sichuanensis]|uniref:Pyrroloquinoline-quinone binding quinoprotein n=1 Tax=Actinoplanes sichuanensis TaxID=512349 RepID=A0ABW4AEB6_9ACTN|nr:hypothetical protein [Actinoplanes sichuanensis]BEL11787.1 hypothetical protein Q0Z83_099780 [Actinoplanes sichuanensis]
MPADLDELFTALSRQADAIPLAGVERARQRGRQRRARGRAALAAAAVVLVALGTGLAVHRPNPRPEPLLPATDPARIRGMAPVGEPLRIADGRMWNNTRIAGDRVIGFSADGNGGHETTAVDARTGAALWRISARESYYRGVATTPKVVILLRELEVRSEAMDEPVERILEFHDPATGAKTWELRHTDRDRFVLHQDVLVRLIGATTAIEGYDLVRGRKLWTAPAGSTPDDDSLPPARMISGMATGAITEDRTGSVLFNPEYADAVPMSDDRLVDMSRSGLVTIRDIRTGQVRSTMPGRAGAEDLSAYEGTIYTVVRGDGALNGIAAADRVIYRNEQPWYFESHIPCGRDRLCVIENDGNAPAEQPVARMSMINAKTGTVLRTTGAVPRYGDDSSRLGHVLTSSGGEKATTLYDENGQARYSDFGVGGFVDDGNALTMTQNAGDRNYQVRGVSNVDFQKVELGEIPEISGRCDWDEKILTCPAGQELWIWRFNR